MEEQLSGGRVFGLHSSLFQILLTLSNHVRACWLTHGEGEVKWMRRGPVGTICAPHSPPPPIIKCPSLLVYSEECTVSCS